VDRDKTPRTAFVVFISGPYNDFSCIPVLLAILLVFLELRVHLDRFDGRSPSGPPVVRDLQDTLHENLKINENSVFEVFGNVAVIIHPVELLDPVGVAFLSFLVHR